MLILSLRPWSTFNFSHASACGDQQLYVLIGRGRIAHSHMNTAQSNPNETPDCQQRIIKVWTFTFSEKEEQFEDNWPRAVSILAELRRYGIYVADVNPGNIAFLDD